MTFHQNQVDVNFNFRLLLPDLDIGSLPVLLTLFINMIMLRTILPSPLMFCVEDCLMSSPQSWVMSCQEESFSHKTFLGYLRTILQDRKFRCKTGVTSLNVPWCNPSNFASVEAGNLMKRCLRHKRPRRCLLWKKSTIQKVRTRKLCSYDKTSPWPANHSFWCTPSHQLMQPFLQTSNLSRSQPNIPHTYTASHNVI